VTRVNALEADDLLPAAVLFHHELVARETPQKDEGL
jgi:hypothetical protein